MPDSQSRPRLFTMDDLRRIVSYASLEGAPDVPQVVEHLDGRRMLSRPTEIPWKDWHAPATTIDDLPTSAYGAEVERLRAELATVKADAMDVYGIVYGQLTAGIVDDHERIMRATNELAEAGRRMEALHASS